MGLERIVFTRAKLLRLSPSVVAVAFAWGAGEEYVERRHEFIPEDDTELLETQGLINGIRTRLIREMNIAGQVDKGEVVKQGARRAVRKVFGG